MKTEKKLHRAIVPGSFDPMTLGHLDVLRRVAALYDEIYLALLINPNKEYLFDLETRFSIAQIGCADIENVRVVHDDGMLVDLARKLGCGAIIKGVRNSTDFEYEMKMAFFNRELAPEIETLFLPCSDGLGEVSSTRVRCLLEKGDLAEAEKLLPNGAIDIIRKNRGL